MPCYFQARFENETPGLGSSSRSSSGPLPTGTGEVSSGPPLEQASKQASKQESSHAQSSPDPSSTRRKLLLLAASVGWAGVGWHAGKARKGERDKGGEEAGGEKSKLRTCPEAGAQKTV